MLENHRTDPSHSPWLIIEWHTADMGWNMVSGGLRKIIRWNGICAYHYFIVFWTAWMFFQFLIFLTCKNIQFCSTVTSLYPVLNSGRQLMTVLTHHDARMLSRSHILYTDLGPKQAFKGRVDNFNINMVYPKV